jgi:glycosyltransferase involved in cell wall biosynthesis
MISVVCSYHNRKQQFVKTIKTINKHMELIDEDVEVICVNHNSRPEHTIDDLSQSFNFLKVINVVTDTKNACVAYNIGFSHANGDKIIIQNAECCHMGNILGSVSQVLSNDNYLSFGCFAADLDLSNVIINEDDDLDYVRSLSNQITAGPAYGKNGWYNHSVHSPRHLHFTTAITKSNLDKLKGFDERYAYGLDFDDDDLVMRVRRLGLNIVSIDDPFSVHLFHETSYTPFIINGVTYTPKQLSDLNLRVYHHAIREQCISADWNEFYD